MKENAMSSLKMNKRRKVGMKDLPLASRPREKLLAKGTDNLTDAELLAILLGTGSAKQSVLALAEGFLKRFPLVKLFHTSSKELASFQGVGTAKAARILAGLELGKRVFSPASYSKVVIKSTKDALVQLRDITDKKQEYLLVFYLNARYELLAREIVGQGSLNSMLITAKEIFAPALTTPCASIIVAHNHPSGDPSPSEDDIAFTKRIHEAGEVMGITLLDHLIVTTGGYFSFRDKA